MLYKQTHNKFLYINWQMKDVWQLWNYSRKRILRQDMSPLCNLCTYGQNNTCMHLLSGCKNKHRKILQTNWHNKAIHTLATTILAHLSLQYQPQWMQGKTKDKTLENIIPLRLLSCMWYLPPNAKCPASVRPDVLCITGAPPTTEVPCLWAM